MFEEEGGGEKQKGRWGVHYYQHILHEPLQMFTTSPVNQPARGRGEEEERGGMKKGEREKERKGERRGRRRRGREKGEGGEGAGGKMRWEKRLNVIQKGRNKSYIQIYISVNHANRKHTHTHTFIFGLHVCRTYTHFHVYLYKCIHPMRPPLSGAQLGNFERGAQV